MNKKTNKKSTWGGYGEYTYLEGKGKDAKPVKFLAKDDEDAQLYIKKVGATAWKKPGV
tara:strand:- start:356 stop:529 length:174 start_codon:yes stop_codon:yes gene_type:complete